MEHRLRRKQFNSDTNASNETFFETDTRKKEKEKHFKKKKKNLYYDADIKAEVDVSRMGAGKHA